MTHRGAGGKEDTPISVKAAKAQKSHRQGRCSATTKIETVQKQFDLAKRMAGLPESIVLYCARHRFSTDAMEGTGNLMAVMDAMGHSKMDVTRLYQHPGTKQIRDAIERRNQLVQ